jgi:hypothetical protein
MLLPSRSHMLLAYVGLHISPLYVAGLGLERGMKTHVIRHSGAMCRGSLHTLANNILIIYNCI